MATTLLAPTPEKTAVEPRRRAGSPFDFSKLMTEEMDRLFEDFGLRTRWPAPYAFPATENLTWTPAVEVEQREGKFRVRVDLPGLKKEEVKVEIAESMLTVRGERKREQEKKEKDYYRSERSYGRFVRTVTLPEGAKLDTAKATFADGVLDILIEVTEAEAPAVRQLAIG